MEFFSDAEMVKLVTLTAAFVVGTLVCVYVAIKEIVDSKRRRRQRHLMSQQTGGGRRKSNRGKPSEDGIYA